MKRLQTRLALLIVLIVALSLMVGDRLFAAGEQLPRAAIFSGGGTITSDDDGSDDSGNDDSNNGSQGKLFLPRVQDAAP